MVKNKSLFLLCIPDNPDERISELLLDTTVVHQWPGPNPKNKLTLSKAKQNFSAADEAPLVRKTSKTMSYAHRTVSSSIPTNHF